MERIRLDGWKAVASYLGRSERTVHRWARDKGLPVHQVGTNGSVFAWADELDAWLRAMGGAGAEPVPAVEQGVLDSVAPSGASRRGWIIPVAVAAVLGLLLLVVVQRSSATQGGLGTRSVVVASSEAASHVGRVVTVCGVVVSGNYADTSRGAPTFLNFDKAYPQQPFMVVIWGTHRGKFGTPERTLVNKRVCATGRVTVFRGVAEIEVSNPQLLRVAE